jgi:hypothetical protein
MNVINNKTGWIEIICGSMFSGKTEELIRRIHRAAFYRIPAEKDKCFSYGGFSRPKDRKKYNSRKQGHNNWGG